MSGMANLVLLDRSLCGVHGTVAKASASEAVVGNVVVHSLHVVVLKHVSIRAIKFQVLTSFRLPMGA